MTGRGHHPAHAERGAQFRRLAGLERRGAHHFLQRDDVGVDGGQHRGDALQPRPAIEPAAAVDIVGGDAERVRLAETRLAPSAVVTSLMEGGGNGKCHELKSERELTCPCCGATLVVDLNLGRIISHDANRRADTGRN